MTTTGTLDLPSMLSFKRSINQGRALFYSSTSRFGDDLEPLLVEQTRVLGTKSFDPWKNREKARKSGDVVKAIEAYSTPNPATIEICHLPENKPFLKAAFVVKYSAHSHKPYMCNDLDMVQLFKGVVKDYSRLGGFDLLGEAYVVPLVTGRFMWRNNDEALSRQIVITVVNSREDKQFIFDLPAIADSLSDLSVADQAHAGELAGLIGDALAGRSNGLALGVEAFYEMGGGMQVHPSQVMSAIERDRASSEVSRVLYKVSSSGVPNQAGFSDQKIGNALRSIDCWHGVTWLGAVAVEPNGVVLNHQTSVRISDKRDFYSLCRKWLKVWSDELKVAEGFDQVSESHELHFVIAVLIRGGVFA